MTGTERVQSFNRMQGTGQQGECFSRRGGHF